MLLNRRSVIASVLLSSLLLIPLSVQAAPEYITIEEFQPTSDTDSLVYVHDLINIRLKTSSLEAVSRVNVQIESVAAELTRVGTDPRCGMYDGCAVWEGKLQIGSLTKGPKEAIVQATDEAGHSGVKLYPLLYHNPPRLQIEQPAPYAASLPSLPIKASCADDLGYVCQVKVEVRIGDDPSDTRLPIAGYRREIDGTFHLNEAAAGLNARENAYLVFTARDSVGQTVTEERMIYAEAEHAKLEALATSGAVIDYQPSSQRVLSYNAALKQLEIKQAFTNEAQTIPTVFSDKPAYAYLTPKGAIFEWKQTNGSNQLVEWRDGKIVQLGGVNPTSLKAKGGYAIFTQYAAGKGQQFIRRNLVSGINQVIGSAQYVSSRQTDLAENGTVVYALSEPGNQNVYKYNGAQPIPVTRDSYKISSQPVTDGGGVMFMQMNPDGTQRKLMLLKGDGSTTVLEADKYIDPPLKLNNGWAAYRAAEADGKRRLWVWSPVGDKKPASSLSQTAKLEALGSNGDVAFSTFDQELYISRVYGDHRSYARVSSYHVKPFWRDAAWYGKLGDHLVGIRMPEEDAAPQWPPASTLQRNGNTLTWSAATDNVGVARYRVYAGDEFLGEVPGNTLTFVIDPAAVRSGGDIHIRAVDAAGNESLDHPVSSEFIEPDDGGSSPFWPLGSELAAHGGDGTVRLSWAPATDDTGIAAYRIYRDDYLLAELAGGQLTYQLDPLPTGRSYTFRVEAVDGAGNRSADHLSAMLNL
ncbi:fibronectin type III domain-containing protein [Paenibacillus xanthanilyticus]|uniref:Fibronectin type-III domain-containing protein n=1 Tax=Paenibacillus xanthanilyticus TaxID=1783531 RepID=A0ABV8KB99_9BACL